jgi:prepilin-type N-terminal cleavage/methylation domain-containing protein
MRRAAGFTLIEVLVAITVVVVSMVALATMSITALRTVGRNGERTVAVSLAQSRIESLRNVPFDSLENGTTTDRRKGAFAGYSVETTIEGGTPRVDLARITVAVRTPGGQTIRLATLVGR